MMEQMNIKKSEKIDEITIIKPKKINEFLYFAFRNNRVRVGLGVVLFFLLLTFIGPLLTHYKWDAYIGPFAVPPSSV
jgi:peptide/nickel transport system permease protein